MGFWKNFFDNAVSIFAFAALILEIFTLIANTYNVRFLRDMYFARLTQNNEQFMDFGLWYENKKGNNFSILLPI
jgi:hypothetical protein